VGDVHGCLELARDLENKIHEAAGADAGPSAILYLGDVIDRGPKSAHVLDHLTRRRPAGLPRMCLRGNHEQFFLDFLEDPKGSLDWLDFGGRETLNSYGIYETRSAFERMGAADIKSILAASIPEAHAAYLRALPHFALGARVLFCHAGVNPTRGIPEQTAEDTCGRGTASWRTPASSSAWWCTATRPSRGPKKLTPACPSTPAPTRRAS